MTSKTDELNGCTLQWKIENISHFWFKEGDEIISSSFNADAVEGTKWSLRLCPMNKKDKNFIGLHLHRDKDCNGLDVIEVNYQLAFVGTDGQLMCFEGKKGASRKQKFLKGEGWGFSSFKPRKIVFFSQREVYLQEDILTVQCDIWSKEEKRQVKPEYLYARTVLNINRRYFVWKIEKFSTLISVIRKKFKENSYEFDLILNKSLKKLYLRISSVDDSIKYVSCTTSVINSEGKREIFRKEKYFSDDLTKRVPTPILVFPKSFFEKESHYVPNDCLSLDVAFVFTTIVQIEIKKYSVAVVTHKTGFLSDHLKSMYNENIFSDTQLQTASKTFLAHKNILSARSPVFKNMFSHDKNESNCGHTVIMDLEADTLSRMLLYIYTDSLEDLQLETACKLYAAADKYQISSLKNSCSSFIKDNLYPTQVCNILVLADSYQDKDLKSFVENYILEHDKEVLLCQEWKDFMDTNPNLAAYVMYRMLCRNIL